MNSKQDSQTIGHAWLTYPNKNGEMATGALNVETTGFALAISTSLYKDRESKDSITPFCFAARDRATSLLPLAVAPIIAISFMSVILTKRDLIKKAVFG